MNLSGDIQIDDKFENVKGELALKIGKRPLKYCRICGESMISDASKLERHCLKQHPELDAKLFKKQGFLKYKELPENSKYSNFELYLKNMDTELKVKPLYKFNRPGRPGRPFNQS